MTNLLKTIVVLTLGFVITISGFFALEYWFNTPLSIQSVLAFVFAYFILLKPTVKYWAGFLVFIAEYRTMKAQMEKRKEVIEKFKADMERFTSQSKEERDRIANDYKSKVDDIVKRMEEEQAKQGD